MTIIMSVLQESITIVIGTLNASSFGWEFRWMDIHGWMVQNHWVNRPNYSQHSDSIITTPGLRLFSFLR